MLIYTTVQDAQGCLSVLDARRYVFQIMQIRGYSHNHPVVALLVSQEMLEV